MTAGDGSGARARTGSVLELGSNLLRLGPNLHFLAAQHTAAGTVAPPCCSQVNSASPLESSGQDFVTARMPVTLSDAQSPPLPTAAGETTLTAAAHKPRNASPPTLFAATSIPDGQTNASAATPPMTYRRSADR